MQERAPGIRGELKDLGSTNDGRHAVRPSSDVGAGGPRRLVAVTLVLVLVLILLLVLVHWYWKYSCIATLAHVEQHSAMKKLTGHYKPSDQSQCMATGLAGLYGG
ncbi:hypothetical protein VOLCADRAFT_91306 [Volvox carteri f. nagariensis]|uniref:Uncharacterized protein n=1 Tax=Volvox carteri f. nagariensis TaxID=3068 RepID=D8TWQ1_VOLCA|nr:uncharacterized protein VOLCADRAFT_91306 [Volvox carteri f. nagariensis]EFJ48188.1 hypothetical protein VOLCADRAFT_91306 [Volvox carteri f. nagariensis]|eukprot:XP_002950873.1 hypothetical protein VOLCADRAFT_91306 [Volvox carteri f. nagariensis]